MLVVMVLVYLIHMVNNLKVILRYPLTKQWDIHIESRV